MEKKMLRVQYMTITYQIQVGIIMCKQHMRFTRDLKT